MHRSPSLKANLCAPAHMDTLYGRSVGGSARNQEKYDPCVASKEGRELAASWEGCFFGSADFEN